jgi:multiple sugar transport system substrate-binding protein
MMFSKAALGRRKKAGTLVIAASVTAILALTGCSNARAGSTGSTAASCDLSAFTNAKIDWKQQSGKTVALAVEEHPWWETVKPLIPCFEKLTGITVKSSVLGEDQFVSKLPTQLSAGASTPDVFMVNQYGQAQGANWLQPLNPYMSNSKLTDSAWYNVNDFFPGARNFAQTNGQYLAMPITAEAQMLFIRTDLVKSVPTTITELETAAAAATKDGVAGFGSRAVASASETPWPFAGFAFSDGGTYLTSSGKAALDSPANVLALRQYADLISKYGPTGSAGWGYLQNLQAMEQGNLAIWTDSSTFEGTLKDSTKSKFASTIDAYPFPAGASGKSLPNAWFWTVGINSKSKVKDASWLFLEWATSLPVSEAGAANGASPARQAAWDSKQASAAIGVANAERIKKAIASVDSSFMANAWKNNAWSQVADPLARAINSAVTGSDPAAALKTAQTAAESVLK